MIEPFAEDSVRGFLHYPEQASWNAIALAHGAGSNCQAPLLVAVASVFAEAGFTPRLFPAAHDASPPSQHRSWVIGMNDGTIWSSADSGESFRQIVGGLPSVSSIRVAHA